METTITTLIANALDAEAGYLNSLNSMHISTKGVAAYQEAAVLANNALEERLQELIEAKVNQMLKRV